LERNYTISIGGVEIMREHIVKIQGAMILGLGVIIVMLLMKGGGNDGN